MSDISNINPKWVTIPPFYKCAQDTSAATINDCGMRNILLAKDPDGNKELPSGRVRCENGLLDMKWEMVARDIAKNVYGKNIDSASVKEKELADILRKDNNNYEKPAEVLKGLNMPFGEAVISTVLLSFNYSQYYSYQRFLGEGDNIFGIKWGSFPRELPIKITGDFKKAVMGAKAAPAPVAKKKREVPRDTTQKKKEPPVSTEEGCPPGETVDFGSGECVKVRSFK